MTSRNHATSSETTEDKEYIPVAWLHLD